MSPSEAAVHAVQTAASGVREEALRRWTQTATGSLDPDGASAESAVRSAGRLTVNFHPDRMTASGSTVAEGLSCAGEYLSQWRTGISSGARSAFPGGDRQRWEQELFGAAYSDADPTSEAFPIYGAWDLLGDAHGGSPRFGSSYLVLSAHVRARSTMCLGDSHLGPSDIGTFDSPWTVLAGLAEQVDAGQALGAPCDPVQLLDLLAQTSEAAPPRRDLDNYVELQVHGGVDLHSDVDAVVLDPSFKGTAIHTTCKALADQYGIELSWHAGSQLEIDNVPTGFRGKTMPALAREVAGDRSFVDARAIGVAARSIALTPMQTGGDSQESRAQQVKYLWHTLLAFGSDLEQTA